MSENGPESKGECLIAHLFSNCVVIFVFYLLLCYKNAFLALFYTSLKFFSPFSKYIAYKVWILIILFFGRMRLLGRGGDSEKGKQRERASVWTRRNASLSRLAWNHAYAPIARVRSFGANIHREFQEIVRKKEKCASGNTSGKIS